MKAYETVAGDLEELLRRRQGRKRKAPITLARLPGLAEVEPGPERVALSRVRLALHGDLCGMQTGEHKSRPRYGVGEATPERMAHARQGKAWLETEAVKFKDGRSTGIQRKRFRSQLELWFERGSIDRATWLAMQTYQRDHDFSISAGGAMIAKYGPQAPVGVRELLPAEMRMEYQRAKARAQAAVDPELRLILNWVEEASNGDISADDYAQLYWPNYSERVRLDKFRALVQVVGAQLSRHYDQKERHDWLNMATLRVASEIAEVEA